MVLRPSLPPFSLIMIKTRSVSAAANAFPRRDGFDAINGVAPSITEPPPTSPKAWIKDLLLHLICSLLCSFPRLSSKFSGDFFGVWLWLLHMAVILIEIRVVLLYD